MLAAGCGPKPPEEVPVTPPAEAAPTTEERIAAAREYMDAGRIGEAAREYAEVLDRDTDNFEAHLNLGVALLRMEDARFENERDYTRIREHLVEASRLRPRDPRPHFYLGRIGFTAGDYREAMPHLSRAVELEPSDEEALEVLALAYLEIGDAARARTHLGRLVELNPRNPTANLELGKIYEQEGSNRLAMEHLERALAANPNLDMALYLLERVYYEEKLYDRAIEACRAFLRLHPDDIQSLEILGNVHRLQKNDQDMLETYGRLARLRPKNTSYWSPLIAYHMRARDYQAAKSILEEALASVPLYAYGNIQYGQVLMQLAHQNHRAGKQKEALDLYLRAGEHLGKAMYDDRYSTEASHLLHHVEKRIERLSGN
jgi:tetratricopeptide (TPR) repeat protein